MVSRVGTFSNTYALIAASMKVQAKLADEQAQEASTYRSTSFSGLGGDARPVLNLSGQTARLTADNGAAQTASAFVQSAYSTLGDVIDLATNIRSQLATLMSGTSTDDGATAAQSASDWLATLQTEMNSQVGGVYLFSGTAMHTAPADFSSSAYDPLADASQADTGYYEGSSTARAFTDSQGSSITLSVTADSPGFEQLARALAMIKAQPADSSALQNAYDLVSASITSLGVSQATVSDQASSLDTLTTTNTDKITALENLSSTLDGADLTTAATLVSQYQTQLEAVYSAIGQLTSDSLVKYL